MHGKIPNFIWDFKLLFLYLQRMYDDYDDFNEKNNDDNMRGWDPASEDDSKDNGMDRWSENNDDKGWW